MDKLFAAKLTYFLLFHFSNIVKAMITKHKPFAQRSVLHGSHKGSNRAAAAAAAAQAAVAAASMAQAAAAAAESRQHQCAN